MKKMKWILATVMVGWMATDGMNTTATMNFDLDTHTDVRIAGTTESIAYSAQWSDPSGIVVYGGG